MVSNRWWFLHHRHHHHHHILLWFSFRFKNRTKTLQQFQLFQAFAAPFSPNANFTRFSKILARSTVGAGGGGNASSLTKNFETSPPPFQKEKRRRKREHLVSTFFFSLKMKLHTGYHKHFLPSIQMLEDSLEILWLRILKRFFKLLNSLKFFKALEWSKEVLPLGIR